MVLTCVPGEGGWALKVRPLTDVFLLESLISDLALLRSSLNFTVVNKNAANDPDRCWLTTRVMSTNHATLVYSNGGSASSTRMELREMFALLGTEVAKLHVLGDKYNRIARLQSTQSVGACLPLVVASSKARGLGCFATSCPSLTFKGPPNGKLKSHHLSQVSP